MHVIVPILETAPHALPYLAEAGPARQLMRLAEFQRAMTSSEAGGEGSFASAFAEQLVPAGEDPAAVRVDVLVASPIEELRFEAVIDASVRQSVSGAYEALQITQAQVEEQLATITTTTRLLEIVRGAGFPHVQFDVQTIVPSARFVPPVAPPNAPSPAPLAPRPLGHVTAPSLFVYVIGAGAWSLLFFVCFCGFDRRFRSWLAPQQSRFRITLRVRGRHRTESGLAQPAKTLELRRTPDHGHHMGDKPQSPPSRTATMIASVDGIADSHQHPSPSNSGRSHGASTTTDRPAYPLPLDIVPTVLEVLTGQALGARRRPEGHAAAEAKLDSWFSHSFVSRRRTSTPASAPRQRDAIDLSDVHDVSMLEPAACRTPLCHHSTPQKLLPMCSGASSSSSEGGRRARSPPVKAAPGRLALSRPTPLATAASRRQRLQVQSPPVALASRTSKQMAAWELDIIDDRLNERLRLMRWLLAAGGEQSAQSTVMQLEDAAVGSVDELQQRWLDVAKVLTPRVRQPLEERLRLCAWLRDAGVTHEVVDGTLSALAAIGAKSIQQLRDAWQDAAIAHKVRVRDKHLAMLIEHALSRDADQPRGTQPILQPSLGVEPLAGDAAHATVHVVVHSDSEGSDDSSSEGSPLLSVRQSIEPSEAVPGVAHACSQTDCRTQSTQTSERLAYEIMGSGVEASAKEVAAAEEAEVEAAAAALAAEAAAAEEAATVEAAEEAARVQAFLEAQAQAAAAARAAAEKEALRSAVLRLAALDKAAADAQAEKETTALHAVAERAALARAAAEANAEHAKAFAQAAAERGVAAAELLALRKQEDARQRQAEEAAAREQLETQRVAEESLLVALNSKSEDALRRAIADAEDVGISADVLGAASQALERLAAKAAECCAAEAAIRDALVHDDAEVLHTSIARAEAAFGVDLALIAAARSAVSHLERLELSREEAEEALRAALETAVAGQSSALAASLLRAEALGLEDQPIAKEAACVMRRLHQEEEARAAECRVLEAIRAEDAAELLEAEHERKLASARRRYEIVRAAEEDRANRREQRRLAAAEAESASRGATLELEAQRREELRAAVQVGAARAAHGGRGIGLLHDIRQRYAGTAAVPGHATTPLPPPPLASPSAAASGRAVVRL